MDRDNGILALVPGDCVGGGSSELPPPGPELTAEPERKVVLLVPDIGPVRITYLLQSYRHGKSRHWHWVAVHAERVVTSDP